MKKLIPEAELDRRRLIRLARSSDVWREIVASHALSGIFMTEEDALLAGRMLSGVVTYEQLLVELRMKHAVERA